MDEQIRQLGNLKADFDKAWAALKLDDLVRQEAELASEMAQTDFWNNTERAQKTSKHHAKLRERIEPWVALRDNLEEMIELASTGDNELVSEISEQIEELQNSFSGLKEELKFSGPYDDHDVILTIYAGAGGTDAQDWARMLLRMYLRWAEKHQYSANMIDEAPGDEAGIKSATLEISGSMVFGKLRAEHGVHRLVRLSPFNSDNLRQTSFAKVDILPKIEQSSEVEVDEKDLRVDVYRAGGHGGQSVNTTDSAVRITHLPTGISVAIQNERSQLQNKEVAMTILRSRLAQLQLEQHQEKISELKGPNQANEWGSQIRSYVLHPYKQVKDLRSRYETSDVEGILDGDLDELLNANLEAALSAD